MTPTLPKGLVTPIVTPLTSNRLDREGLRLLIEDQIAAGAGGIVVTGGVGEFGALSIEERKEVAAEAAAILDGRIPLVVQTGSLSTSDSIELSRHAQEVGAAAILLASPFGDPITWTERKTFYEQVDAAVSLPILIYNTPTAGILSFDEIKQLAALPNVKGIKASGGNVTLLGDLLAWGVETGFAVYVGFDSLLTFAATNGGHGAIIGTGNVAAKEIVQTWDRCREGRTPEEISAVWAPLRKLVRYIEEVEATVNYVALFKAALTSRGVAVGEVRPPFLTANPEEQAAFQGELEAMSREFARVFEASAG